nr:MAG TPA: hypothetical protein [Caudoviricetes sp.]
MLRSAVFRKAKLWKNPDFTLFFPPRYGTTGDSVRPRRFSLQRSPPCPTSAGTATPATAISASCTTRVTAPCSAG